MTALTSDEVWPCNTSKQSPPPLSSRHRTLGCCPEKQRGWKDKSWGY